MSPPTLLDHDRAVDPGPETRFAPNAAARPFRDELNFLLTNRLPRRLATRFMGWFSKLHTGPLTRVSIGIWRLFARDLACGTELFQAKGFPYSLPDLLGDDDLVARYRDGVCVTLRLKSSFYHRCHAPCEARLRRVVYISGDTWNVNPIALRPRSCSPAASSAPSATCSRIRWPRRADCAGSCARASPTSACAGRCCATSRRPSYCALAARREARPQRARRTAALAFPADFFAGTLAAFVAFAAFADLAFAGLAAALSATFAGRLAAGCRRAPNAAS